MPAGPQPAGPRPAGDAMPAGTEPGGAPAALVTGAGSPDGIGFAIAAELVAAGFRVAVTATTDRVRARAAELGPRTWALEGGRHGVTANSVAPGWIATAASTPDELRAGAATPVGRPGRPAEVAAAVAFPAFSKAGYITGQVLVVGGGNVLDERRA